MQLAELSFHERCCKPDEFTLALSWWDWRMAAMQMLRGGMVQYTFEGEEKPVFYYQGKT